MCVHCHRNALLIAVTLDPELERQLGPIAKPDHLADIAARGYTPTELKRLAERQPLRGKVISKIQMELEREAEINARLTGRRPSVVPSEGDGDVEMLPADTPTRKGGAGTKTFPTVSGVSLRTKMADSWPEKFDIKRSVMARGAAAEAERMQRAEATEEGGAAEGSGTS